MSDSVDRARRAHSAERPALRLERWVATAVSILFLMLATWACFFNYGKPRSVDFLSFWAAAKLVVNGEAALAYDVAAHRAVEMSVTAVKGLLPFAYPPPFLLVVSPLALAPYWLAFTAWVLVTAGLYVWAARPLVSPRYAFAHPPVLVNSIIGQNGFLTSAIFMFGTAVLDRRPFLGGAILGAMVIKPQLALLLPVALIAGREWRAIAGGIVSSGALLAGALLILGPAAYQGFLEILPLYTNAMTASRWPWNEIASPFAFARHIGVAQLPALLIHGAVALLAALLTWRAWARRCERRVPILAAATVLIAPYSLTYDGLLLMLPLGWLIRDRRQPAAVAAIWLLCLLPIGGYLGVHSGPNTLPIAALACLWALHRSTHPELTARNEA